MTVNGLTITSSAQVNAWGNSATVQGAATITNTSSQILYVVAVDDLSGSQADIRTFVLVPGQSANLGVPTGIWIVTVQTQSQAKLERALNIVAAVGFGALAGIGLADLIVWAVRR